MYKVLLVDDEPYVLEGLRDLIPWNKYDFNVCGEASNGSRALELLYELEPDLVITDIRMPGQNGLDFIAEATKVSQKQTKFMILSSYEIFDYIKRGISLNIVAYLLKPMDIEEIEGQLSKVRTMLINENRFTGLECDYMLQGYFDEMRFLSSSMDEKKMQFMKEALLPYMAYTNVVLIIMPFCKDIRSPELLDVISSIKNLDTKEISLIGHFMDKAERVCLFNRNIFKDSELFHEYLGNICDSIKTEYGILPRLFVSHTAKGADEISKQYDRAMECYEQLFYRKALSIHYWELKKGEFFYNIDSSKSDWFLISHKNKSKSQKEFIIELFQYFKMEKIAPGIVRNTVYRLITEWNWKERQIYKHMAQMAYDDLLNMMLTHYTLEMERCKSRSGVEKVLEYVKENYKTNLKLNKLSQEFHFNTNYLGKALLKETGMPLSSYVHYLRIQEAKRLLVKNDLQIMDIASCLGYKDYDYFVQIFKKMEGLTPSTYKSMRLEQRSC